MRLKELLFLLEFNATASVTGRVTSSIRTNATARFATRQREMWDQAFYICSVHVLTNHHNRPASEAVVKVYIRDTTFYICLQQIFLWIIHRKLANDSSRA